MSFNLNRLGKTIVPMWIWKRLWPGGDQHRADCFLQFKRLGFVAIGILLVLLLDLHHQQAKVANAATPIQLPLATRGSQIVDATGTPILLRGVNWFGIETDTHVPHGLWARDYRAMIGQIRGLGYNLIRLPYSVESLRSSSINSVNFSLGANRDLEGKTPLQVMDLIIQEAAQQGILVLLDSHRLNSQRIPELWYGDGFTEADWIDTWTLLANRYKGQLNVIGADLKNEPHGVASWGTYDLKTDWRLAAERCGKAILAVNPNWLIVVEGVENNVPGQTLTHWMGGNLEGVARFPVRLPIANKLVYSPHEYGSGVFNQPWFSEPAFPANLYNRWEKGFHYIAKQEIAPILIGEFGGRQVDPVSKEGIWQRQLVEFIGRHSLSFAYWSWNPNSADTGGILQDDWQTVQLDKQFLLNTVLAAVRFAPQVAGSAIAQPTPQSTILPSISSTPSRSTEKRRLPSLVTSTSLESDWQTGFCMRILVKNRGDRPVQGWHVTFRIPEAAVNQLWNASLRIAQGSYMLIPAEWAQVIEPSQTRDMGFCARKLGRNYRPVDFQIVGY
jgi:endoglucanase